MYLTRLASGQTYRELGASFDLCKAAVCVICLDVACAIIRVFGSEVRLPTADEVTASQAKFLERFGLAGCVGAIDGTHIRIVPRVPVKEAHYNHKGYHSFHLHACCDNECVRACVRAGGRQLTAVRDLARLQLYHLGHARWLAWVQ